jgi:hypothetical protein
MSDIPDYDTDELLDELRLILRENKGSAWLLFRELDKRMKEDDCPSDWGGGEEADDDGDEDE